MDFIKGGGGSGGSGQRFISEMYDVAPCFKKTKQILQHDGAHSVLHVVVEELDRSAQRPDRNPIHHVLNELKPAVCQALSPSISAQPR